MILAFGDSKKGLVRKINEDSINLNTNHLYLLADGMGGYSGGQIASSLAVQNVGNYFETRKADFSEDTLKDAFFMANSAIINAKKESPELHSMGTTMIAAAIKENTLYWAHVGDSRLYKRQNHIFEQITTDHSFVMELVAEGKISKEEMRVHPRKNEITRAVGIEESLKVDTGSFNLVDDTCILICSDGVTSMIKDDEIEFLISSNPRKTEQDMKELGNQIMDKVYQAGARDNASLILIQFWG